MLRKILGISTAIALASCLIGSNSSTTVAVNLIDRKQTELSSRDLIAQARVYRVRLGDTLGGIAYRNGLSLSKILNYNPQLKSRPNLIYVGEMINLGASGATSISQPSSHSASSGNKYTVRRGDTLGGIAIRHGLSLNKILDYNPHLVSRPNRINVGERINVGFTRIIRQSTTSRESPTNRTNSPNQSENTSPTIIPKAESSRRTVAFKGLPTIRKDGSSSIGAIRGNEDEACTQAGENMRAIAPENGLGYTFDDYPYFFWYFPGIESGSVPISLDLVGSKMIEVNGQSRTLGDATLYTKNLNLDRPGIIAFQLPASESNPLQEEQEYTWRINIQCTEETSMSLNYSMKRLSTDNPQLTDKLETAPVDQHPVIYAESGVWFDALKMIALQREQAPGEPTLEKDWNQVLKIIGFDDLIGEPIQYIESN